MTPTITILGERIHRILNSGDVPRTSTLDPRDLEYLIRDQVALSIKGEWFEARAEGAKDISSQYVATFTAAVLVDEVTLENYADLPISNWIRLPDDTGIQSVRPYLGTTNTKKSKEVEQLAFIPIPNRYRDLIATLPSEAMEGHHCFQIRGNKLVFTKRYDRTVLENGIKDVEVDAITVDPTAIDVDDVLPIPQDMVKSVIAGVLMTFGIGAEQAKEAAKKHA